MWFRFLDFLFCGFLVFFALCIFRVGDVWFVLGFGVFGSVVLVLCWFVFGLCLVILFCCVCSFLGFCLGVLLGVLGLGGGFVVFVVGFGVFVVVSVGCCSFLVLF